MRGHWQTTGLRKLNRHYQSFRRPSFIMAKKFIASLTLKAKHLLHSALSLKAEKDEENKMYKITSANTKVIKKTYHKEGSKLNNKPYIIATFNLVDTSGEGMKGLKDNGEELAPSNDRYLGAQISFIWGSDKAFGTTMRQLENYSKDDKTIFPSNGISFKDDAYQQMIQSVPADTNWEGASLALDAANHNTKQLGNNEYVGVGLDISYYNGGPTGKGFKVIRSTESLEINNPEWKKAADDEEIGNYNYTYKFDDKTFTDQDITKNIPVIGQTWIGWRNSNESSSTHDTAIYVLTPTIFNKSGEIVTLN